MDGLFHPKLPFGGLPRSTPFSDTPRYHVVKTSEVFQGNMLATSADRSFITFWCQIGRVFRDLKHVELALQWFFNPDDSEARIMFWTISCGNNM